MNYNKHREHVEPTLFREKPLLGGVNTQRMSLTRRWEQASGRGMPGAQSTWWGAVWTSKGKNYPGKGHLARGHQWGKGRMMHNEAPSAAPAVVPGKGGFSWGGRGRGWNWMVPQGAPCHGNLPGNPPWRKEQAPPGSEGGGAKGREPGARSQQPRRRWNPKGQSHFGRDQCSGGHQWGKGRMIHNKAPSAAPHWSSERVLCHGVEWVAVGTGWCHRRPAGATYLETPQWETPNPGELARGEGQGKRAREARDKQAGSSGEASWQGHERFKMGTTPSTPQTFGVCCKEVEHRLHAPGDKGCGALTRSPLSLSETAYF